MEGDGGVFPLKLWFLGFVGCPIVVFLSLINPKDLFDISISVFLLVIWIFLFLLPIIDFLREMIKDG